MLWVQIMPPFSWKWMISKKQIKYLASLSKKKFREQNNELIIEGPRILSEAIKHSANIQTIFITEEYLSNNNNVYEFKRNHYK